MCDAMKYTISSDFSAFLADETGSTMDLARFVANSVDQNNRVLAIFARKQRRGRGRNTNLWEQASVDRTEYQDKFDMTNLQYFENFVESHVGEDDIRPLTLVVPPSRVKIPMEWLTLAVGAAVWDAFDATAQFVANVRSQFEIPYGTGASPLRLKWPNDIWAMVPGKPPQKICGVLCETSFLGNAIGNIFVGIGLNFFKAPELPIATTFYDTLLHAAGVSKAALKTEERYLAAPENKRAFLTYFLSKLQQEIQEYLFVPRTAEQLRNLVLERSFPVGTHLCVDGGIRRGRFDDIDIGARLIIAGEPVLAGDISIVETHAPKPEDLLERLRKKSKELKKAGKVEAAHASKAKGESAPDAVMVAPSALIAADAANATVKAPQMFTLALDFGNTRMHWAMARGADSLIRIDTEYAAITDSSDREMVKTLRPLLENLSGKEGDLLMAFCSVKDRVTTRRALDVVQAFFRRMFPNIGIEECEVHSRAVMRAAGMGQKYTEESLGVDRALRFSFAAEKARATGIPVAVLGAGTALTCEAVSADGEILESLILPGFQMSLKALHSFTAKLPDLAWKPQKLEGNGLWDTERSMMRGVAFSETGALLSVIFTHGIKHLFISGGDAEYLVSVLRPLLEQAQVTPEIHVVDGLETSHLLELVPVIRSENDAAKAFVRKKGDIPAEAGIGGGNSFHASEHLDDVVKSLSGARKKLRDVQDRGGDLADFRRLGVRIEGPFVGARFDQFLAEKFKFHSREEWRQRILAHEVCIQPNAARVPSEKPSPVRWVKHTYRIKNLDQVWFYQPQEHEPDMAERCDVLADDGDVVVFSKPGNLVIHAVGQYSRNTFLTIASRMGYADAAPIHRIDRETSGILVCARSTLNRRVVADAFRDGLMEKMYLAVTTANETLPERFRVDTPIGDAVNSLIRLKLWVGGANAMTARTHFVRLAQEGGYALYACFPQTGRTNQIRIHLASVGAWIVGDKMYHGDETVFLEFFEKGLTERVLRETQFPRHMLHNAAIRGPASLPSLLSDAPVICPIPNDMLAFKPLHALLNAAGLSENPEKQADQLQKLIEEYGTRDFENEPAMDSV